MKGEDRQKKNEPHTIIRKVKSYDCVIRSQSLSLFKERISCSPVSSLTGKAASRFSKNANRKRSHGSLSLETSSLLNMATNKGSSCQNFLDEALMVGSSSHILARSPSSGSLSDLVESEENGAHRFIKIGIYLFISYALCLDILSRKSTSTNHNDGAVVGRAGLGSAMIGSVTEVLSPILPFAGGVDLRRDENWGSWSSWFNIFFYGDNEETRVVQDTFEFNSSTSMPHVGNYNSYGQQIKEDISFRTHITLSSLNPFVSTDIIARMTLSDVAIVFSFAIESGRVGFSRDSFVSSSGLSAELIYVIDKVNEASEKSRGVGVMPASTQSLNEIREDASFSPIEYGDVDCLLFCAAMRIFAEWRLIRQTPEGFKAYAIGMSLGHKDVVQNVAKIENAVHNWIETRSREVATEHALMIAKNRCLSQEIEIHSENNCLNLVMNKDNINPRSPTIKELLSHEIEVNLHPNLPRLKDNSAAMGLLWVNRQLQYQTTIFENILNVPDKYPSMNLAVSSAYSEVYDQFHSWAVQKIFNYSFQAAPDVNLIFRHMNPNYLNNLKLIIMQGKINFEEMDEHVPEESIQKINSVELQKEECSEFISNDVRPKKMKSESNLEKGIKNNTNPFQKIGLHIVSEWNKVNHHLGEEMDKFGGNMIGEFEKVGHHMEKLTDQILKNLNISKKENIKSQKIQSLDQTSRNGLDGVQTSSYQETNQRIKFTGKSQEKYISQMMESDARSHITLYMKSVKPLVLDLVGLFAQMNCEDPTKV